MPDDPRILQLLQAAMESNCTLDEACSDSAGPSPEVRRRWENCRLVEAQLKALFPATTSSSSPEVRSSGEFPQIPGYEVEAVLGRGGAGVVYKARHVQLRRPVAIKMMLFGKYANGIEVVRF